MEGIGQLTALVDTGARSSVLAYEQVPDGVALKPVSRDYRSVDGSYVMNIVGEIDITVVFESKVVHLTEVAVLRELPYPMLLGMDFISKGNVTITGGGSGASVAVQEEVKVEQVGVEIGVGRFTVEDVKRKLEEIDWSVAERELAQVSRGLTLGGSIAAEDFGGQEGECTDARGEQQPETGIDPAEEDVASTPAESAVSDDQTQAVKEGEEIEGSEESRRDEVV